MNLSLDLILGVEPAVLFLLLPSCVQLAGSPRAEPEARTCVGGVYSGKRQGRRETKPGGSCVGHLNLDLSGTDHTLELLSQGMKEKAVFPLALTVSWPRDVTWDVSSLTPPVCSGQHG